MYENNVWAGLPKYFNNLHLEVAAITGSPRIAKMKEDKNGKRFSDTYKNISQEEWESAILNWAGHLEKGFVQVLTNGNFVIAGNIKEEDKIKGLAEALRRLADELSK